MACKTSSCDCLVTFQEISLIFVGPMLDEFLGVGDVVLWGLEFSPFLWYILGSELLPEAAYSSSMSIAASNAAFKDS